MNNSRKPIGKVSPIHKIDVKIPSVEDILRSDRKIARREKMDRAIQLLGKGLRSVVNTIDIDSAEPTTNPNINRRAGRTAISAAILVLTALTASIGYAEISETSQSDDCNNYYLEAFGTDANPGPTAEMITNKLEISGSTVDSGTYNEIVSDFENGTPVEVCGSAVHLVDQQIPENS